MLLSLLFSCGEPAKTPSGTISEAQTGQATDNDETPAQKTKTQASSEKPELTPEMWTAFQRFRLAMLQKDRNVLVMLSVPELINDCVYDETDTDSLLWKVCDQLDGSQLKVLEKRVSQSVNADVTSGGCVYKDSFEAEEDGNGFYWSVGCIHLLEKEIGEYATIFHFKKINGKFRLDAVQCAG